MCRTRTRPVQRRSPTVADDRAPGFPTRCALCLPARPGGLVVNLYRVMADGRQILIAQARASAATGEWSMRRRFLGSGRFGFVVRSGQDLLNAPGTSNVRPTSVF